MFATSEIWSADDDNAALGPHTTGHHVIGSWWWLFEGNELGHKSWSERVRY